MKKNCSEITGMPLIAALQPMYDNFVMLCRVFKKCARIFSKMDKIRYFLATLIITSSCAADTFA